MFAGTGCGCRDFPVFMSGDESGAEEEHGGAAEEEHSAAEQPGTQGTQIYTVC